MDHKPTYEELEKRITALEEQTDKKAFSEKLARTLFEISNAVNAVVDLNALYQSIYDSLNRLMKLPNFYIAIYDKKNNLIQFPFHIDEFKDALYPDRTFSEGDSLTSEVIAKKHPVYLNEKQLIKRKQENRLKGRLPKIWIGVPLILRKSVIGVVAIQSYSDPDYFAKEDVDIIVSASNHIALAIERKQSLDELDMLKNYLYNIINSMPSILVGVDKHGSVTQWNSQAEVETGVQEENAKGKNIVEAFPRMSQHMEQINQSIQFGKIKTLLKQEYFTGEETRYEDIIIYPLITKGVEGVVIRMDDITDQVRMEEMVMQSEKMLSIGGLAAGMAHEINNPLAGMMQNAQLIYNRVSKDIPANEKAAGEVGISMADIRAYMEKRDILRKLDLINETGSRAADIVKNMLGFARKSDTMIEPHDLSKVLKKTIELAKSDYNLKKQYDFKRIAIIEKFDPLPPVRCDKNKLQQVFLNILKNGAQAMFEWEKESFKPQFILRLYKEDFMACIEIEDNGPGMNEKTRKRLFEPFFTTKPVGEGTGLGLSISYFIVVKDHKGKMTVESSPGQGTRFRIKLPY